MNSSNKIFLYFKGLPKKIISIFFAYLNRKRFFCYCTCHSIIRHAVNLRSPNEISGHHVHGRFFLIPISRGTPISFNNIRQGQRLFNGYWRLFTLNFVCKGDNAETASREQIVGLWVFKHDHSSCGEAQRPANSVLY